MTATTITEVLATPESVHWGFQDGNLGPAYEVADGATIRVRTVQGGLDDPVPAGWLADDTRAILDSDVRRGPGPHILTGPVAVRGANPGDVLAIDLLDIRFGAPYGINRIRPGGGLFPEALAPESDPDTVAIPIDPDQRTGRVPPGIDIPLRPFFGIVATAPPPAWGSISTIEPRANGGNVDCKELIAGTRLFLPVFVPGANVSFGDGHAAQGDGEIDQTAVETCLDGDVRMTLQPQLTLDHPLAITPAGLIAMGFEPTLEEASRAAVDQLLTFLEQHCGLPWFAGYRIASVAVDLRITQVVNRVVGVHAVLPHSVLSQLDIPDWLAAPAPEPATNIPSTPGGTPWP